MLISFFIALIFSVTLVAVYGWQRPGQVSRWNSIIFIFIILFVATWAGAIWMIPFGPVIWGVYLMPFLLAGFMLALLVVDVTLPIKPQKRREALRQDDMRKKAEGALGAFFLIFLFIFLFAIAVSYLK